MITYGNLVHQFDLLRKYLKFDQSFIIAGWVPYYHDYCLICGILNVLYGNGTFYMMSPFDFLANPGSWFDVVTKYRATHIAGPNFGFELIMNKSTPERRKNWDLSSLRLVQNSSEPVRVNLWKRFTDTFSSECKLDPTVLQSAFGLAEHTVGVTVEGKTILYIERESLEAGKLQVAKNEGKHFRMWFILIFFKDPKYTISMVSCGYNFDGEVDVRIVNPKTLVQCEDLVVGEIWANSPSKAIGMHYKKILRNLFLYRLLWISKRIKGNF